MSRRNAIALLLLVHVVAAGRATAQERASVARAVFHKGIYLSYQRATLSDVPVSYRPTDPGGVDSPPVRSEADGIALGVGGSWLLGDDKWLVQVGYDRATALFTDWRVTERQITFHSVDFTVGYALPGAVALVPFLTVAPGWYTQGEFEEFDLTDDSYQYEALDSYDYSFNTAVGAKLGFLCYFVLTAELRWYREDQGGGACGATPNCIDVTDRPPAATYGKRASFGLQALWHS
ncbi:MAG: hypothetical protein WD771_09305 [Gemmatimonadaceae bacterium]